jgi:DNA repair protein RecN (Recombination protein N)
LLGLLHIENIALIARDRHPVFSPGFNALTGETGAGKSIVIDATGRRSGRADFPGICIRTGADHAFVSAEFSGVPASLPALAENGIVPEEGTLLLQREIGADGHNFCRVNGRPVTVAQLREIGNQLLNIHGQHDGQQLLDEEQHIGYLDRFGKTDAPKTAYRTAYAALAEIRKKIQSLQMDEAEKARRVDSLKFQISELENADLQPEEEEELQKRRNLLRNGEKYMSALQGSDSCLNGDDEGEQPGAVTLLRQAQESLFTVKGLDEELQSLFERLNNATCEVYDLAETIRDKCTEFDFSPEELDAVESRCDLIYRLEKKYGPSVEEMLAYLDKCREDLDSIESADDSLERLKGQAQKAEQEVLAKGELLRAARAAAARELEKRILKELRDLDMNRVRFSIEMEPCAPEADGIDRVRFLMSANAGEDLRPIAKIASGGELARIMLALKNVLAEQDFVGTMVFDEVDTGVSGRAAQKVAEKLAQVSRSKQVLCVTHLPQLAAMADTHFSVAKGERDGRTYTNITQMDTAQRKAELARLTGGSRVTDALLKSAGELLDEAEEFKRSFN